jgi:hypothetical protein
MTSKYLDLQTVHHEQFAAVLQDNFTVRLNTDAQQTQPLSLQLRLTEVKPSRSQTLRPSPGFSLFFSGVRNPLLPQQIICLRHAQLGDMELFLVPVAQDQEHTTYEAVFN